MPRAIKSVREAGTERITKGLLPLAVEVDTLVPDPENANLHPERSIQVISESLTKFGQTKPIVVRGETMIVVAGNGTLESAKRLGWKQIAANVIHGMTDAEAMEYALADNKTAEESEWNYEVVQRQTALLAELGMTPVGWSSDEIAAIRALSFEPHQEPDKTPEPPPIPVSELGDLWLLGDHRLMCADAADEAAVVTLMDGRTAMLLSTDPPYGVDFEGQKYNPRAKAWAGIEGDKRQGQDLDNFLGIVLNAWLPHIDEGSGFYFWTAAMAEGHAAYRAILSTGLHIQAQIIWNKNCLVLGQADFHWKHENCWYAFWKGKQHRWFGARDKTTVWEVDKVANAEYLHPMQKPVELYERPMEYHTKAGDVVAEPFAGSGTQFIAAHKMGRVCYGMELDPQFTDVTLQRFLDYTGIDPVREADGMSYSVARAAIDAQ